MKAIVTRGFGLDKPLHEEQHPLPIPQEGQVRIRIKAAGFNPVDWKIREGWFGGNSNAILGCDCSGIIDALGPNASDFSEGDEVLSMTFFRSSNGSYAEYACVPVELVAKKPRNLTFEEAAGVPLASMTAYRATIAPSAIRRGDSVFIAGAGGGVGCIAVQMCRIAGAEEIYTLARDLKSAQFLQDQLQIPLRNTLIYTGLSIEDLKTKLFAMNGCQLFPATLDFVGGELKRLCMELTGYSGHFSTILPEDDFTFPIWNETALPRARNHSIHQVSVGAELSDPDRSYWKIYARHLAHITRMLEVGELKPPPIHVLGPLCAKTVDEAHLQLKQGHVKGKLAMRVA